MIRRSRGWLVGSTAAFVGIAGFAGMPARAAVSPKEVDAAVDKAVAFLKSQQQKDGSWETGAKPKKGPDDEKHENAKWGGETAIATYALLAAGEKITDPKIKEGIDWLLKEDLHGTYAVGLRSQVWSFFPDAAKTPAFVAAREHDKEFVLYSQIPKGPHMGFYGYFYGSTPGGSAGDKMAEIDKKGLPENAWYDRSNSQYMVLGAWALEQAGAEIPTAYWLEEDTVWKKVQLNSGAWNYSAEGDHAAESYTMTSAGIATLFITQDYVMRANSHQFDNCKGGVKNENIEKGLAWMDKHINQALSKGGGWYYYGLYGIERIGVASGRKYFGTVDWFQVGADSIVHGQAANGSFGSVHDTCFALLFLVRGRAPVMMNKLIYETASKKQTDPWNERPRDTANLAKWMGKHSLEGFLNWQVVNLKVQVDELHDSPILYLSGSEELSLSKQDIEKLRLFVEQGGMILGNADCSSKLFSTSFKKLGDTMFPKYEFKKLPANHPIYSEEYAATKWKSHPIVEGKSNGVRELMILIPEADLGKAWQVEATKTREEAYQLAGNIFLYATGKENLEHKGATYIVHADGPAGREIKVARLEVGDNWDPEPGAWRRLTAVMHNEQHVDIKAEPVKLGAGALAGYKIAALTGTTKLILSADQRKEVKDFVDKGGTLIVDAAGGAPDFADTAEGEIKQMFGAEATAGLATPLPPEHPALGDFKTKVQRVYRRFARQSITGSLRDPRLRGITVAGGRVGVFFSREDITAGLVGEPMDGIVGYEPAAATEMMSDLVMYAEKAGKGGPVAEK